jgi:hypothetical protein
VFQQITRTVPIVFAIVNEPVTQGIAQSLAHPGGNITGFAYMEPIPGCTNVIRRAFAAAGSGAVLSTRQLTAWTHPRDCSGSRRRNMLQTVRRACVRLETRPCWVPAV